MAPSKAPAATWSKTGITGARWGIDTAEAILQLRALQANGDFDAYWATSTANTSATTRRALPSPPDAHSKGNAPLCH